MQRRETDNLLIGALACFALIALCLIAWPPWSTWSSIAQSQQTAGASSVTVEQDSILRSAQKPKAPISDGRLDTTSRNRVSAAEINSSMLARRNQAWAVVEQVWAPVSVMGGKIPGLDDLV